MSTIVRSCKIVIGSVLSIGIGLTSATILPNTVFINKLKEVVQMYRHGGPMPVSENVLNLVKTVMDDMNLSLQERDRLETFTVFGFDPFHAGSTYTKYGGILGIPSNFYYSSIDDIDVANLTIQNKPVDWLSNVASSFKESLILSEEAQKFLIAREIACVNSPMLILGSTFPISSALLASGIILKLHQKLHLSQKPPIFRGISYVLGCLFGFGTWVFLNDFSTIDGEFNADKAAITLGDKYFQGGLEAYSKLLQRNVCLRELMGPNGPKLFTSNGNEVYFLRQKHAPISNRLEFLVQAKSKTNTENPLQEKPAVVSV